MAKKIEARKPRRGRPPSREPKRAWLSLRVTQEMRDHLERESRVSGRSLAAEVENLLERGLQTERNFPQLLAEIYGFHGAVMVQLLGRVMRGTDTPQGYLVDETNWLDDAKRFAVVRCKVELLLDAFAPPGAEKADTAGAQSEIDYMLASVFAPRQMSPVHFGWIFRLKDQLGGWASERIARAAQAARERLP